jgi:hypothetical protein
VASLTSLGVRGLPPPQDAVLALEALARARTPGAVAASPFVALTLVCAPACDQARAEQEVEQIQALLQERSAARAKLQARPSLVALLAPSLSAHLFPCFPPGVGARALGAACARGGAAGPAGGDGARG